MLDVLGILLVLSVAVVAVFSRRAGAGARRSTAAAPGRPPTATMRLNELDLESPPADDELVQSPPPSPPPVRAPQAGFGSQLLPSDRARHADFDFCPSEEEIMSMLLEGVEPACEDDASHSHHERPPAEEQMFEAKPAERELSPSTLAAKYQTDGIPMNCEGASAGEEPIYTHELPLFTRKLKRPSADIEAPTAAPTAFMGAPSIEPFGLADQVDEQLLYDVIEAEVNEASRGGDCWDAAPAGAADYFSNSPHAARRQRVSEWSPEDSNAVESGCSSQNQQAQPPAGEPSPLLRDCVFPQEPHLLDFAGQPPAGESPPQSFAQPTCVSTGPQHQPPFYAPSFQPGACMGPPFAAPMAALAAQLGIAQRLTEISQTANLPSAQQLQSLLAQGVDPSLVEQLAQLSQLAQLARVQQQYAPAAAPWALNPLSMGAPMADPHTTYQQQQVHQQMQQHQQLMQQQQHLQQMHQQQQIAGLGIHGMPGGARGGLSSRGAPPVQPKDLATMGQVQAMQCVQNPHLPRPSPAESQHLLSQWLEHVDAVSALAEKRRTQQVFERRSHRHFCQGCGRSKAGHRRSEVHSKCVDPVCWCGVPRMLHPGTLPAGARCSGEWRDICLGCTPSDAVPQPEGADAAPPPPPLQAPLPHAASPLVDVV